MEDANATRRIDQGQLAEERQFDFLEGEWDAICRFRRPDGSWGEGPGTLKATKILDGPHIPIKLDVRPDFDHNVLLYPGVLVVRIVGARLGPVDPIEPDTARLAGVAPTRSY